MQPGKATLPHPNEKANHPIFAQKKSAEKKQSWPDLEVSAEPIEVEVDLTGDALVLDTFEVVENLASSAPTTPPVAVDGFEVDSLDCRQVVHGFGKQTNYAAEQAWSKKFLFSDHLNPLKSLLH